MVYSQESERTTQILWHGNFKYAYSFPLNLAKQNF